MCNKFTALNLQFSLSQSAITGACVVCCKAFHSNRSITEFKQGFQLKFNQQEAPSPNTIHKRARHWYEDDPVTYKRPPDQSYLMHMPPGVSICQLQSKVST